MSPSNSRRVAKNALLLYVRTAVNIAIQLIAVRYLLKYLGNEDYGLYGLIGSIVTVVESLKGLFASSIQRFINIEIGAGRPENIKDIFNASLRIHVAIGILLFLITAIIGFCSIPFLKIPADSVVQAYWVLMLSAATMCIGTIIVPYDAVIIAFEKFNAYAAIAIFNSILKLAIVFLLVLFPVWRVVVYSALLLAVTLIIRMANLYYCRLRFNRYIKISNVLDKSCYKRILKFVGFKTMGTISSALQNSGINFVLNIFGGLLVNTARTITYQILTAVNVLVWNINVGFSSRMLTLWGEKQFSEFYKLLYLQAKITFIINISLGGIFSIFICPILKLWLGEVPNYVASFIPFIFLYAIFKSFDDVIDTVFSASGDIKKFQITKSIINILSIGGAIIAIHYLMLPFSSAFAIMALFELCIIVYSYLLARHMLEFPLVDFLKKIGFRCCAVIGVVAILFVCLNAFHLVQSFNALSVLAFILVFIFIAAFSALSVFSTEEMQSLKNAVLQRYKQEPK